MTESKTKLLSTLEQLVRSLLDLLLKSPNKAQLQALAEQLDHLESEMQPGQHTIFHDICERLFTFGANQQKPQRQAEAAAAFGKFIRSISPTTLLLPLQMLKTINESEDQEGYVKGYATAVNAACFALRCYLQPIARNHIPKDKEKKLLPLVVQTTSGALENSANETGKDYRQRYLELSLQVIQQLTGSSDDDEPQHFEQITTWLPYANDFKLEEELFNTLRNCSARKMQVFIEQQQALARTSDDQRVVIRALTFCNFAGPLPMALVSEIAKKFEKPTSKLWTILLNAHKND